MSSGNPAASGKSLVLVLGAGASKEVKLPIGAELKAQISKRLDIRFPDGYRQTTGDHTITQALRLHLDANGRSGDINPLLAVSRLISDALPLAISIDNFIDSHRSDERIALCGKLAIVQCILKAESESTLILRGGNIYEKLDFNKMAGTWYNLFFQALTENCQKDELPLRLQKAAIVSFNYDRCFEHYLYLALQSYYGMTALEAAAMLADLEIHHPYGKVGALPWMKQTVSIDYGETPTPADLLKLVKLLRTFTEGTDPAVSRIEEIRATVASAKRLLFMGFAFHRLNIDLLFPDDSPEWLPLQAAVFATAYGLSKSDVAEIQQGLRNKLHSEFGVMEIRNDLTCAALFQEYWRSLSLAQ